MSEQNQSVTVISGSDVVRNYAYILFGILVFPLMIYAHFVARKKRHIEADPQQSHYHFQYGTTSVFFICFLIFAIVGVFLMIYLPPHTGLFPSRWYTWSFIVNMGRLPTIWLVIRSVRGLYLSSQGKIIQKAGLLWLWPQ